MSHHDKPYRSEEISPVVGTFPKEMETRMAPRLNGIPAHLTLNKTWNTAILFLLDEEKQHHCRFEDH